MSKKVFMALAALWFLLPATAEAQTGSTPPKTFTVQPGNSLWRIARQVWSKPEENKRIADANGIKAPYTIYPGQVLVIPDLPPQLASTARPEPVRRSSSSVTPVPTVSSNSIPTPTVIPTPTRPTVRSTKIDDTFVTLRVPFVEGRLEHNHDGLLADRFPLLKPPALRARSDDPDTRHLPRILRPFAKLYDWMRGQSIKDDEVVMILTGYDACPICTEKHPGDPKYGITANGSNAFIANGIATDNNEIPMGTVLDIPIAGIGKKVVDDTGGTMRIAARHGYLWGDVRFATHQEAHEFGSHVVKVKVDRSRSVASSAVATPVVSHLAANLRR